MPEDFYSAEPFRMEGTSSAFDVNIAALRRNGGNEPLTKGNMVIDQQNLYGFRWFGGFSSSSCHDKKISALRLMFTVA